MGTQIYTTHQIEEFADGDYQFLKDTVAIFIKEAKENINKLDEACETLEWKKIRDISHRFAPHFSFFEIGDAYDSLRKIESLALEQSSIDEIKKLLVSVNHLTELAVSQMIIEFNF